MPKSGLWNMFRKRAFSLMPNFKASQVVAWTWVKGGDEQDRQAPTASPIGGLAVGAACRYRRVLNKGAPSDAQASWGNILPGEADGCRSFGLWQPSAMRFLPR